MGTEGHPSPGRDVLRDVPIWTARDERIGRLVGFAKALVNPTTLLEDQSAAAGSRWGRRGLRPYP